MHYIFFKYILLMGHEVITPINYLRQSMLNDYDNILYDI